MVDLVIAAASAFGVIFVAELGDKTQFLALGFGARHPLRTVLIGLTIGYACAGALAALVGGVLGATLPERPLGIAAGLLFIAFAIATLLDRTNEHDEHDDGSGRTFSGRSVVASIALTIAIGELGDKTQLSTAALAARSNPVAVWIGATAGEVTAGAIGAVAGLKLGARLDRRVLRLASAALFGVFGVALIILAR
jgi:Ca2+/H+ antiporter, TMEM165/GDT1 family